MGDFAYPATIVKRKNGAYEVRFIDLDDAFTEGATLEEALENASEVLSGVILTRLAHEIDVPKPSKSKDGKNVAYVLPDGKTQSALLIREAFSGQNIAQIARSMDTSWPAVSRLKDPGHWPTLKLLDRALKAAGKQLVIGMKDRVDRVARNRREDLYDPRVRRLKGLVPKPPKPVSIEDMKTAMRKSRGRR